MTAVEIFTEAVEPSESGEIRRMLTLLEKLRKHLRLPGSKEEFQGYVWLQQQLDYPRGKYILCHSSADHISPWFLAENGARVLLVERGENRWMPLIFRSRYALGGFYRNELEGTFATIRHEFSQADSAALKLISLIENFGRLLGQMFPPIGKGSVLLLRENPARLEQIPKGAVDQVIVPDTMGKYTLEKLPKVIDELLRVLKEGNALVFNIKLTNGNSLFQDENKNWVYPLAKFAAALNLSAQQKEAVSRSIAKAKYFEMPQGGGSPIVEIGFKLTKLEKENFDEV